MKPEAPSLDLLGVTRSKAKMFEYSVPAEYHIRIFQDPARLFRLAISILGDISVGINTGSTNQEPIEDLRDQLQFAARFFDAYLQSQLNEQLDFYLLLLGSAAYYLCELPGSSDVLARSFGQQPQDLGGMKLEDMLLWLLRGNFAENIELTDGPYSEYIAGLVQRLRDYFETGNDRDGLISQAMRLREISYQQGTPRQLLFADVAAAVIKKRIDNSVWTALPAYSGLTTEQWSDALKKATFPRELWPAQHLLGKHGVFGGKSAIVQMPTSAGKTKSIEVIIRSGFLAGRVDLAVVVAPFRALCHEIKNALLEAFTNELVFIDEPSDVIQMDFHVSEFLVHGVGKKILIVTPEKLTYLLRHSPELAASVGLLIYDEGHQFDSEGRGVTYELLLSSLKRMIPVEAQTVLISAVLSNASDVGDWLNGSSGEIVLGSDLIPTYRSVAFASWQDRLGRLEFVKQNAPDLVEFYVPRVIEQQQLQQRPRERKIRTFPDKGDGLSVALYLGIKLVANGSVAIFCGQKNTVTSLSEKGVDIYKRGLQFLPPVAYSDQEEVDKLHFLHLRNLGADNSATLSANLGFFSHSRNTPYGIRLSVEYAMQKGLVKFVICTSTLAQGVNLPIRYLIVTSIYQAGQRIKVRDFHNLMGRAGRSGMHTEGSILFADPAVFDTRNNSDERWRWKAIKALLDPVNAEPCTSMLQSIFDPWLSDNGRQSVPIDLIPFVADYIDNPQSVTALAQDISSLAGFSYARVIGQIAQKQDILSSVESFLLANWSEIETGNQNDNITALAQATLAYNLSNPEQQFRIVETFKTLGNNIREKITEPAKRKAYGRTLYGVRDCILIEDWVLANLDLLIRCESHVERLAVLWPLMYMMIENSLFKNINPASALFPLASQWMAGKSFHELLEPLQKDNVHITRGTRKHEVKLEAVIEICENVLAYEGTLIIGAVAEIIALIFHEEDITLIDDLRELQKRVRYGLSTSLDIVLYELGFSDRVVAKELSSALIVPVAYRQVVIQTVKNNEQQLRNILSKYPSYFTYVMDGIMNGTIPS